jgi:hypothetical protein
MAKVVVKKLRGAAGKPARSNRRVESRPVRTEDGRVALVRTLDARSDRFGEDLGAIFRKNVRKARSENKRVTGRADFVPDRT